MDTLRKITVSVPESVLEDAQKLTGDNVTAAVVEGLRRLQSIRAQQELRTLRGKLKGFNLDEMRHDRE